MELRSRYNRLVKGDVCHLERHYQIVRETPKAYATKVVLETINWLRRKIGGMVKTHGMLASLSDNGRSAAKLLKPLCNALGTLS